MRPKAFLTDCSTLYVGSRKNALDYKPMLHEIFGRDVIAGREKPWAVYEAILHRDYAQR